MQANTTNVSFVRVNLGATAAKIGTVDRLLVILRLLLGGQRPLSSLSRSHCSKMAISRNKFGEGVVNCLRTGIIVAMFDLATAVRPQFRTFCSHSSSQKWNVMSRISLQTFSVVHIRKSSLSPDPCTLCHDPPHTRQQHSAEVHYQSVSTRWLLGNEPEMERCKHWFTERAHA
jgi:hypothetical protein